MIRRIGRFCEKEELIRDGGQAKVLSLHPDVSTVDVDGFRPLLRIRTNRV